jgi:hypothetical protein
MKLTGEEVSSADTGDEFPAIIGGGGYNLSIFGNWIIGMDKVKMGPLRDPCQGWKTSLDLYGIPAHMGNFQRIL